MVKFIVSQAEPEGFGLRGTAGDAHGNAQMPRKPLRLDAARPAGKHVRIECRAVKTGIAGCLITLRAARIARHLSTLRPACLASRLAALRLAGIARRACGLAALGLAGIACVAGILITGLAGILAASRPACIAGRVAAIRAAGIIGHAGTHAGAPKTLGALLGWATARLVGHTAKRLTRTLDSNCNRTVEIGVWNIGLSPAGSSEAHVQVKLIMSGGGTGSARILDHRIFFNADTSSLKSHHRGLLGWDGLRKDDVFASELCIVSERPVKVEPCPSFPVALSGQSFQYHYVGGRSRGLGPQLVYNRILIEKSFFTSTSFLGSHVTSVKSLSSPSVAPLIKPGGTIQI